MTVAAPALPGAPVSGAWHRWWVLLAAWGVVGLFSVGQVYLAQAAMGHPPPLGPLLRLELPVWLLWALVTVPVVMLERRVVEAGLSGLVVHAAAAVLVAVAAVGFQMLWYQAFNPYPFGGSSVGAWFWQYFRRYFVLHLVLYGGVVGVRWAWRTRARAREREIEVTRARAQLTEARLEALRMQLRPHFLFNTLNSVSALVGQDPALARRVLAEFSEVLRAALRTDARSSVSLEEEAEFLLRYLELERLRFGSRLEVEVRIAEEARRAAVPTFLLQPLVENALRHAIAPRPGGGRLWVTAAREGPHLVAHVMDDGPGLPRGPLRAGIGLENTRRRLAELYGDGQSLRLAPRRGGGLDVRIELPFSRVEVHP